MKIQRIKVADKLALGGIALTSLDKQMRITHTPLVSSGELEVPKQEITPEANHTSALPIVLFAHLIAGGYGIRSARKNMIESWGFKGRIEQDKKEHFEKITKVETRKCKYGHFIIEAQEITQREKTGKIKRNEITFEKYDKYLKEMEDLLKSGMCPREAIPKVLGNLRYFKYATRMKTAIEFGIGNCLATTELVTSLMYDLGYANNIKLRFYRGHVAPIYAQDGVEYDLASGRRTTINGIDISAIEYLKRFDGRHEQDTKLKTNATEQKKNNPNGKNVFYIDDIMTKAEQLESRTQESIFGKNAIKQKRDLEEDLIDRGLEETEVDTPKVEAGKRISKIRLIIGGIGITIGIVLGILATNPHETAPSSLRARQNLEQPMANAETRETNSQESQCIGNSHLIEFELYEGYSGAAERFDFERIAELKSTITRTNDEGNAILALAKLALIQRRRIDRIIDSREHTQIEIDRMEAEYDRTILTANRLISNIGEEGKQTIIREINSHELGEDNLLALAFTGENGLALALELRERIRCGVQEEAIYAATVANTRIRERILDRIERMSPERQVGIARIVEEHYLPVEFREPISIASNAIVFDIAGAEVSDTNENTQMTLPPLQQTSNRRFFALTSTIADFSEINYINNGAEICNWQDHHEGIRANFSYSLAVLRNRLNRRNLGEDFVLPILQNERMFNFSEGSTYADCIRSADGGIEAFETFRREVVSWFDSLTPQTTQAYRKLRESVEIIRNARYRRNDQDRAGGTIVHLRER